jgi:resuscitation-promoting factor RpfB
VSARGVGLAAATGVVLAVAASHAHIHFGPGGDPAANRALANTMARASYGWDGQQRRCLDTLWAGESGFSQYADTRASGLDPAGASVFAYGIPQSRPATKMPHSAWPASLGGSSDPRTQVRWGLRYIASTYGSPCAALAAKRASGNLCY